MKQQEYYPNAPGCSKFSNYGQKPFETLTSYSVQDMDIDEMTMSIKYQTIICKN